MYDAERNTQDAEKLLRILELSNLSIRTYRSIAGTNMEFRVRTLDDNEIRVKWMPGMLADEWCVHTNGLYAAYIVIPKGDLADRLMDAGLGICSAADALGRRMFDELGEEKI